MIFEVILVIVIYFTVMVIIGWLSARKVGSVEDYYVGGRAIGPWLTALSFGTVYFSAVIFTVAGSWQWHYGLSMAFRDSWGTALLGTALSFIILGPRLRYQSVKARALTVPDYFEYRYGSVWVRLAITIIIFYTMFLYAVSLLVGMAKQTEAIIGLPYLLSLMICALIVLFYTVIGGYIGAVWTQAVQAIIMVIVTLYIGFLSLKLVGGLDVMINKLYELDPSLTGYPWSKPWICLIVLFVIGFLPWGNAASITRFYGIKHESAFRWAILIAVLFAIAITLPINIAATATRILYPELGVMGKTDIAISKLIIGNSPPALAGLFLAGIYAASMSTATVMISISSQAIVKDITIEFILRNRIGVNVLKWTKIATLITGLLTVVAAINPPKLLADLWGTTASVVSSSLVGPLVLSLYWSRTTSKGVIAGSLSSWLSTIMYCYIKGFKWPYTFEAWVPSIILSFSVTIIVSLLTKPPSPDKLLELGFRNVKKSI
ncbi:MAG: hypothetical protein QW716_00955 [Desulfurococcaceae archaeon]